MPSMTTEKKSLVFRQLFDRDTCTYTYILGCPDTKNAIIIDPVVELVERDKSLLEELGLNLKYGVNTHVHADHITGTGKLKQLIPGSKSVLSKHSGAKADVYVDQGDHITFGNQTVECRTTPGHTNGCMTYVLHDHAMAFTGDALLIRGCGRTDFQQGCSANLYDNVHSKILSLPDHFTLYVAHDYKGRTVTTVGEEKKFNPRLTQTKEKFIDIMKNLNLSHPKYIDKALPANMVCGVFDE